MVSSDVIFFYAAVFWVCGGGEVEVLFDGFGELVVGAVDVDVVGAGEVGGECEDEGCEESFGVVGCWCFLGDGYCAYGVWGCWFVVKSDTASIFG